VTSYTYSYDETEKKRTVVTEVRAGMTLTSKSKSVVYEVKPNTNPDESIRYDENDNEYVTKTWYTQGPNGIYDRRVARQDNPDGTRTVYTYNRSGDTDTTTTLQQRHPDPGHPPGIGEQRQRDDRVQRELPVTGRHHPRSGGATAQGGQWRSRHNRIGDSGG